jgi:hypothetical protein
MASLPAVLTDYGGIDLMMNTSEPTFVRALAKA